MSKFQIVMGRKSYLVYNFLSTFKKCITCIKHYTILEKLNDTIYCSLFNKNGVYKLKIKKSGYTYIIKGTTVIFESKDSEAIIYKINELKTLT